MTKQDILDYFSLIDFAYNESGRLESLSRMLDELLKEQEETINELQNAYGYLQKQFFEAQDKLFKQEAVVRCKDCIYKEGHPSPYCKYWCNRLKCGCDDDWFCADGVANDINVPNKEGR